jgi:putative transposase
VEAARRKPGSTWHLDEMFVTLRGEPHLLWRAVDEHGDELDILLQKRRDKAAAKRFFKRCCARARCRARSSPINCAVIRPQRPKSRNLRT